MKPKHFLCFLLACCFAVSSSYSQEGTVLVAGLVKDKSGMLIANASVTEKGTQNAVVTNASGLFSIRVKNANALIVFSAVGYAPLELVAVTTGNMVVEMEIKAENLSEVAVVGYGRQKKISVVGSQVTVKPEELKIPVRDLTNALAGRLAGVVAVQRSGEPGYDASSIFIRGVSTFASSPRSPLLVVDGVPDRSINNIDPEDIESFTVLKDASATAVFGTRGANGVILVNTKKGKAGKAQINVEVNQATSQFTQLPGFVDAPTFMKMFNEGLTMRGRTVQYADDVIQKHATGEDPDLYPNVDWFKELFNKFGNSNRVNLNVRGGSSTANYYISAGYYNEVGMFKRDEVQAYNSSINYNRYNFTSNVNVDLTKSTKLELGINGFLTNGNYPGIGTSSLFSEATRVPPHVVPAIYSNGQAPQYQLGTPVSPYIPLTRSGYATEFSNTVRSNIRLKQDLDVLIKGLSITSMFAFDNFSSATLRRTRSVSTFRATGRDATGKLLTTPIFVGNDVLGFSSTTGTNRRIYTESSLNYSNTFKSVHNVSGMLLYNQSDYVNSNATDVVSSIPFRIRGLTGRATYGYDNKYFVEGNFGYTGSENFTPNSRYGLFPSVGTGWVVSNEKFFDPISKILSHFKLRYSYGLSGNSNTADRFLFLTQINTGNGYTYGVPGSTIGYGGLQEGQVGSDVTWETSKRHNLGIEVSAFHNELQLIVELFKERREGILIRNFTIPYASGYRADNIPYGNIGITSNKGIDASLTYTKNFKRSSFISFNGSFNFNQNRNVYDGLPPWQFPWLNRQGHPIDQRFGYIALGLFSDSTEILASPSQAGDVRPGDIKYKDLNGDGIINSYDQTAIGFGAVPRMLYGLNFGFGYRGFDLSLFFQGAGLVDFNYASGFGTTPFSEGATYGNMYNMVTDRWTGDTKTSNPRPFYPRMSTNQTITTNYQTSTWWIKRADYVRLKNAEIGYNFSARTLKRFAVSKMRIYVNGTNLFTKSRWNIWDPELGDGRGTSYPNTTMYNVGFRVSFN
jgi:TonB-linked SusC/RagA family outer membrane protein